MLILPAIDLYGGKAVRLLRGDYRQMTIYSEQPVNVARDFAAQGAAAIHLVDLEGARDGTTPNLALIRQIKADTGLTVEIGGGIRSMDTARRYLEEAGVDRIILGTAAVRDPKLLEALLAHYCQRIAVGVDLIDGQVAIKGWTETAEVEGLAFCRQMEAQGVATLIVTDISRDGAMRGANLALYSQLTSQLSCRLIASGGVSSLADITALREAGLWGAILGKAYYTGAVSLSEAIEVAA